MLTQRSVAKGRDLIRMYISDPYLRLLVLTPMSRRKHATACRNPSDRMAHHHADAAVTRDISYEKALDFVSVGTNSTLLARLSLLLLLIDHRPTTIAICPLPAVLRFLHFISRHTI